ncbi:uncharacterized protein LOC119731816 [Patiria miniata]|uniref:GRF-type domain-containing protein n=1 Tax=Patiria miniata TaxID=46514 RepID=A0A914AAW5_PATMI|nr:uncharacterized protein LOC119731816 [Patiria miniata]
MHGRMESDTKRDFGVLYTHQKTKKSKTWQDGFLRLSAQGTRAILLDEKGSKLDALHVKPDQVSVGEELESDRYLITIEEEKATTLASACSSEVHQQQQQQQQQQQKQQQQQHQPAFGSQKRIPLKRKRTGFTVPRQASKKLATEDASLTSTSVSHTPSSVVDHTDPVTKPTLFSRPFATAGESKSFRTNFLNVYDGGMQASTSANVATCVSMDGKSPITWDPRYPSDLSGRTFQENQTPVTSGSDNSFAPPCFDVGTPQMDPTCTSDVCNVETTNNLHHSFWQDNQPTENGMGRHESDEVEQLKENIPNFSLTDEHSMQKSKTIPLKENVSEANNERNSAGRRSTSQILALLGNGKTKIKPPVKQPELESDIEVAPKTQPIPASDIQVAISPKVHFQASEPSFPALTFSEDEDVMTLLGQAKAESTAVSCIDPPRDAILPGTDDSKPSLIFNRQGKTETTQDESPAFSVKHAMYPESMENGVRCENSMEVQITKAAVGRDEIAQESDFSHITNGVEQKISEQDRDHGYPCRVTRMEETENLNLSEPTEDDRKQTHDNQEEEKFWEQGDTNEDRSNEDTCRCNHSNRKEDRHSDDESVNQADTFQAGTRREDRYCSDRKQDNSIQNRGNVDNDQEGKNQDSTSKEDSYCSNRKRSSFEDNRNFNENQGDTFPESRCGDGSCHSDRKQDSCHQDERKLSNGDKQNKNQNDKIQDGGNGDDRDHVNRNDRDIDEDISILENGNDAGQGNCNHGDEDKNDKIQGERTQEEVNHIDSVQGEWNLFPRTFENNSQDDREQESWSKDDIIQDDGNCDDRNQDERNCDDRNWDDAKCDDRNQDEGNCDDRNQDDGNCDDRNQDDGNCDDRNWDDAKCDDRNQDEGNCDDRNQGDRNRDDGNCDDRNQDDGNCDDRNQDDRNRDDGNCDDRNQDDGKCDDGNQGDGNCDDRSQDDGNCDDRNRDEGNCDDRNRDEGKCDDGNQDDGNCDDGNREVRNQGEGNRDERNQDDGICDDRNQDKGNYCDDRNQNERNCDDGNQDEGKLDDRHQDERNRDDRNQGEGNCDDRNRNEGNCDDRNQDDRNCDDRNQDDGNCDDRNQDEGNCDDRNQDEVNCHDRNHDDGKCDDRNHDDGNLDCRNQDEESLGDRNKKAENCGDRSLVNTKDGNLYEKQHETIPLGMSVPQQTTTDAKDICTLCGTELHSAQEMCEECAKEIEGGFESTLNSTSEISGNAEFECLDHQSLRNEILKIPLKEKSKVSQETPLTPLSTYEFSSPKETIKTEVKDLTGKVFAHENPLEYWLRSVEPFINTEEDISDSVVPQIGTLQPRNTKHEGLQKLDIVQEGSVAETGDSCPKPSSRSPIVGEQCVPEQAESSSEYHVLQQDNYRAVSEAAGKYAIISGIVLHSRTGSLEPSKMEFPSCIFQEQKFCSDPASRCVDNPSLKTRSDIPQYLPVKWKGVARRSKQETVSHKVEIDQHEFPMMGSLQVLNTTGNQMGIGTTLMQESQKDNSYANGLEDLAREKELTSLSPPLHNYHKFLPGTRPLTSNSRWTQDSSLQGTSSGVDVPRRCPDSKWRSAFKMSPDCEGDCSSMSPCSPISMHIHEDKVTRRVESQFPQSVGYDSLSDCQKVSPDIGTTGLSKMPRCYEETESIDGVYVQRNPSLQSRQLSPRCWPMFPGYSQHYAELEARCDEQPEVLTVGEGGPDCSSLDLRRLDRDWVMEIPERDPSSGVVPYTQETVEGRHPNIMQSFHPEESSGMPPHSQLKRRVSDDVSNTSEGSFPSTTDKETKKKKRDNYWYNPVSSGTVRRGTEAPTIFQAKARREVPASTPIQARHQVPYWMQEEDVSQDEYLRCKTSHRLQETSQWDRFQQNSPKSGSVLEREYTVTPPPRPMFHPSLTVAEDDIDSRIHPTPDTNSELGEYLSRESPGYHSWNSDHNFNRTCSPACDPYLSQFLKNASLEVNEDAPHILEDLSHPEVPGYTPTGYQMLETPASFRQQFHPTSDTISVPGAERNIGLPHMEATCMFGTTKLFPREDSASTFQSLPTPHTGRSGRGFQTPTMTVSGQTALSSGRSICGDLFFPSADEVQGVASLQRQVQIPASFSCVAHYKQVLTSALKEHLNIILFELSQRYHSAKDKADVQHLDSSLQQSGDQSGVSASPRCDHGNPAKMVCVKKEGANKGRFFYACSAQRANQCKFFMWADKFKGSATNSDTKSSGSSRPSLTDPTTATVYFRSHNIKLYYGCELQKRSNYSNLMPGAPAWIRKHKQKMLDNSKKKLYLKLSRKESSSSYGKEDIWVISKDLTFDPRSTFLARSVYHGPSSNNDVEIEPLYGYSTSNWTSSCTVHALLACNASSELTCLNNIQEYINARSVPILPFLLGNRCDEAQSVVRSRLSAFKPPAHQACSNYRSLGCSAQDIEQIATGMIERHHLNTDQAAALRRIALMFQQASNENANPEPVTLIHGVFGAGKSFLLAITVLFLLQLFELSDALYPGDASQQLPWKLLIASTTNVAVDRILLGLLQLGFEDFIRVGSIKKIAKPVLPYSVHASDKKDSQEIRDLYEMLKTDLTPTEKHHVRRSIERQRLGRNKDLLGSVRVVGVTCAACTFPCMSSLKFPVILLDECSQMTEPSSLLPIARFQCEKLVLVGDPKQLDPTIQGSEAAHRHGLEQTLFNRLILLGCEPILLRTQYRCHPTISAIANCLFYDQQLIDGVSSKDRPPLAPIPTLCFYSVSSGKECCASDGSYYNEQEASFVIFLIETLVLLGVEPADIGVITLYKAQTVKINVLLQASKLSTQNSLKAIQISTVDAFQGGEKGVIILSCVRTDYMGFADSDKRTNVALTRSKNHLLIVGNLRILSANSLWGKVIDQSKGAENGIQFSQAFIKYWTPRLEELANQEKNKDQTGSKATTPESSPNFSPTSEVEDSTAKVQLPSLHDRSPSYSPLSAVEESEGDTSLKANEQMPCFDIGDMQDLLE